MNSRAERFMQLRQGALRKPEKGQFVKAGAESL